MIDDIVDRIKRVASLSRRAGPFLYRRWVTPFLPRKKAQLNGVDTRAARLFDSKLPWRKTNLPGYEAGLISAIEKHVEPGHRVVIVGGGRGVTAVKAAQQTGDEGCVTVFEGSVNELQQVKETLKLNDVDNLVEVRHGIVGQPVSLRGDSGDASSLTATDIPKCDVLELDCEGSEIEILQDINIRPEVIIVESHGLHNAPSDEIKMLLYDLSYTIISEEIAEWENHCDKNDIYAITAVRH